MSEPFIAEIKIVSFNFPPKGWAFCNGQIMSIAQNTALFSLLGTTYGGNGTQTFALPNLQSRTPIHRGNSFVLGQNGGEENHAINAAEMPVHTHTLSAAIDSADTFVPSNSYLAKTQMQVYNTAQDLVTMHPTAIGNNGGAQPHNNMQPYLVLNFIIAMVGIFPSRN